MYMYRTGLYVRSYDLKFSIILCDGGEICMVFAEENSVSEFIDIYISTTRGVVGLGLRGRRSLTFCMK